MGLPILGNNAQLALHVPASGSNTWSHVLNGGSNRLVMVGAYVQGISGRGAITGVTFNGVAMTLVPGTALNIGTKSIMGLYYMKESLPAAGTYNVNLATGMNPTAIQDMLAWSICLSNVWQTNPFQTIATPTATGTSTAPAGTLTSNYSDFVISGMGVDTTNPTVTGGSGVVLVRNLSASAYSRFVGAYKVGAAGSTPIAMTLSASGVWGIAGLSVRGTPGRNFQIVNPG